MHNKYVNLNPFDSIIIKAMNAGTWFWNIKTNETIYNERWAEIIGYTLDELKPVSLKTWSDLVHPDDLERSNSMLKKLFTKEETYYTVEVRMKHRDGHWIWVLDSGQIFEWSEDGKPLVAIGTHIDISHTKKAQMELEKSERNLSQIIDHAFDIIYCIDIHNVFCFVSKAWTKRLGYTNTETVGRSFKPFVHPDDLPRLEQFFSKLKDNKESQTISNFRFKHVLGFYRYYESNASAIYEEGEVVGFSGITRDITALVEKQREIEYLSYHDFLTGFYNRHYLDHCLKEIDSLDHYPLSIISIDLNDLKQVNDTYGHHMGDFYIKQVASLIMTILPSEYLFRMGGDEFLIFLSDTDLNQTLTYRKTLFDTLKKMRIETFVPSIAYGFEIRTTKNQDIYEDIKIADHYMYENKNNVKNGNYK
ncbi:PAS domain-containing protein [Acholeplasma vituli]|uniref:PAS domain-containing protein n=1 Tax=Paracholeplasma vituli TaxID=69473 RepID=A0ABT2PUJ1_9MOLU|nr:PAS domain-containing protein [Paracholeplasma vituli]MCU0104616.1 PAS domain-containing protein [Paracholeplasma vituli]